MFENEHKEATHNLSCFTGQTARETLNGGMVGAGLAGVGHWVAAVVQGKEVVGTSASGKILGVGAAIGSALGFVLSIVKLGAKQNVICKVDNSNVPTLSGVKLTDNNIRAIAGDAFRATGGGDFIRKILETKDPEEREMLRADWEKKAAKWKEKPLADMIQTR